MHNFNIGEFGVVDWRVWKLEKKVIKQYNYELYMIYYITLKQTVQ